MAQITPGADNNTRIAFQDSSGNVVWGLRSIGTGTTAFTVLVLCTNNTSYYMWVNSSGVLKIGTTEPTTSTIDSAGSSVGGQS
jgi:hypothetical protein